MFFYKSIIAKGFPQRNKKLPPFLSDDESLFFYQLFENFFDNSFAGDYAACEPFDVLFEVFAHSASNSRSFLAACGVSVVGTWISTTAY